MRLPGLRVPEPPRSAPFDSRCTTRRHSRPSLKLERACAWPRRLAPASRGMDEASKLSSAGSSSSSGGGRRSKNSAGGSLRPVLRDQRVETRAGGLGAPPRRPGQGRRLDRRPDRDDLTHPDRPPPRMAAMAGLRRCRPPGAPTSTSRGTETTETGTPGPSASESTASQRFRRLLLAAQAPLPFLVARGGRVLGRRGRAGWQTASSRLARSTVRSCSPLRSLKAWEPRSRRSRCSRPPRPCPPPHERPPTSSPRCPARGLRPSSRSAR
jgi:hypothetical protein